MVHGGTARASDVMQWSRPFELYLISGISSAGTVSALWARTASRCRGSSPVAQDRLRLELTSVGCDE